MPKGPYKGQKGFTPEVFERQLFEEFRGQTGVDLTHLEATRVPPLARELLPMLIQASKEVVSDAQVVINQRGVGYKNFIPATFGSQAAARFSGKSRVRLKQTALLPRNPKNEPNPYEAGGLAPLSCPTEPAQNDQRADGRRKNTEGAQSHLPYKGLSEVPRWSDWGTRHFGLP